MKIAIANDHAAVEMKKHILKYIESKGHSVTNFGTDNEQSCDYPVYAEKVATRVANGEFDLGILICGTGIGMSLAANKVRGIRAACCSDVYSAKMCRQHNNANILTFGARVIGSATAEMLVDAFLDTEFEDRHKKRVDMISQIESKNFK